MDEELKLIIDSMDDQTRMEVAQYIGSISSAEVNGENQEYIDDEEFTPEEINGAIAAPEMVAEEPVAVEQVVDQEVEYKPRRGYSV